MSSPLAALVVLGALCLAQTARAESRELVCTVATACIGTERCKKRSHDDATFSAIGDFSSGKPIRLKGPEYDFQLRDVANGNSSYATYAGPAPNMSTAMFSLFAGGFFLTLHGLYTEGPNGEDVLGGPLATTYFGECLEAPTDDG